MADLEERVSNLENKVKDLEININKSLNEIKVTLTEISVKITSTDNSDELKNKLIEKDVAKNAEDIKGLKENQSKVVWAIVMAFLGLIGEAIIYYIQNKP